MENKWPEGIKKTKQRKEVYNVLLNANSPMSAVDIYKHVPEYALSTIYRILAAFEEKNMVLKSNIPGEDIAVYEINRGVHKHYAMCLSCHELVALKKCPFESAYIETQDDFEITGHKIEIYGYCNKCREKEMK